MMTERLYTREEMLRLLSTSMITDEFRAAIEKALADGSEDAIKALGRAGATVRGESYRDSLSAPSPDSKGDNSSPHRVQSL